jgi:atypical dual specificity phosphatase
MVDSFSSANDNKSVKSGHFFNSRQDNHRDNRQDNYRDSHQENHRGSYRGNHQDNHANSSRGYNHSRGGARSSRTSMAWRLPDRWSDYTAVGKVIPEARIIAFKTPLKSEYFGQDSETFGVKDLLQQIKELGGELGLVVDLTYTRKYYDPIEFEENGIEYKKIFCPGRDFEELEKLGSEFVDSLKEFFEKNKNNGKWVGIHCTHGLNRTGYLTCRYLHEGLGWPIEKAIEKFQDARGHAIDRQEYINELKKLSIKD